MFSWIVWFYKAGALFHFQFFKISRLELVDVTEDIECMCEICYHLVLLFKIVKVFKALLTSNSWEN